MAASLSWIEPHMYSERRARCRTESLQNLSTLIDKQLLCIFRGPLYVSAVSWIEVASLDSISHEGAHPTFSKRLIVNHSLHLKYVQIAKTILRRAVSNSGNNYW